MKKRRLYPWWIVLLFVSMLWAGTRMRANSDSIDLVKKSSLQVQRTLPSTEETMAQGKKVAIFIFEGVQIIDYTGPYEVFGQAGFDVFTVAEKATPITTAMGMSVTPRYTFENHPEANVLVIPGGNVPLHQNNPAVIRWIQENTKKADSVLSVCNGAFFLARAGLLDGLEATTFASLIPGLREAAPKTKVVSDKRFVDNGKIITSAGLSSGIDGSLHVVEKLLGRGWAQVVATGLEYNWDPKSKFVRAALADQQLRAVYPFIRQFERRVMKHEGSVDRWTTAWKLKIEGSSFFDSLNSFLESESRWHRQKDSDSTKSRWKFTDANGGGWSGEAVLERVSDDPATVILTLTVKRL